MQLAGDPGYPDQVHPQQQSISVANATLDALRHIRNPEDVAKIRGKAKGAL